MSTKPVVVWTTWEASFVLTGPGGITVDTGLGRVDDAGPTLDYPVQEREAVVIG